MSVERVLSVSAILGEGPVWTGDALWFVDIKSKAIHRYDPLRREARRWDAPDQVGWVLPTADGGMVAGLKTGLHRFSPDDGKFALLHRPEPETPGNRLNDATTDREGRLWFGSMDDGERAETGRLYRCDGGACRDTGLPPVSITNGPAISADARTLYHTDTLGRTIWRVQIDLSGELTDRKVHIRIEDGAGYPDGSVMDADGCLWVALFGGWGVRRYDPDGQLMSFTRFPVANVTKIAFGGADLTTAYATTASKGLDAAALQAQPFAGDLFAFDPGTAGLQTVPAKI
jgi:D-xylonolactonase